MATAALPRSMAPGNIAPGSFHESSASTSHASAASAFNVTRSTAPYLARSASVASASAHTSGTGSFAVSGKPATPGTAHGSIAASVHSAGLPFGFPNPLATGWPFTPIAGHIPDTTHVTPPPPGGTPYQSHTPPPSSSGSGGNSGNSGGNNSENGNQNYGSSPQGTLESGALGNLLYDLLGPAGTGVTPGDAGLQVTPTSPTTTTSSPNMMVGLLALGVLAGVGWYYLKQRKKGKGGGSEGEK
jgi:hypothetical protein